MGGHARAGESIDLWIVLFNTITNIRNWVLSGASRDWEIRTGERKSKGGRGRAYWPGPINECHGGGFSPGNLEIMGEGKKIVLKVTEMQVLHWEKLPLANPSVSVRRELQPRSPEIGQREDVPLCGASSKRSTIN